ncbi:rod shape-determining protein [Nonomuraea spiralis]|uniref:Rod shape-determining protein n=1 Tax=Nonomuraea spiralis TaxID=46182 RepID=A0ABV5I8W8_9ACTN|nr:rod shape-determining protein [Nonomuraea spiralis]
MRLLGRDLAMDLGAASTRIYAKGKGIVLDEPSAVMRDRETGKVVGYGAEAADGADGETYWPISDGLPQDGELTRRMIRHFLHKVHRHPFPRPRLVMAVPDDFTPIERVALRDAGFEAEARGILLVRHAVAAALGAGLPLDDSTGHMVIDIGRDAARIAVLSCGSVVTVGTVRGGGGAVTRAVARLAEYEHGLLVGEREAEAAKLCSVREPAGNVLLHGRDADTGEERAVALPAERVREAAAQPVEHIVRAAEYTVERCPAELAADLGEGGLVLVGGGALLPGLRRRLRAGLSMPVRRAERPTDSVALGLGRCVEDLGLIARLRHR